MVRLRLRRGTFRHIEEELAAYHETKKEINRLRNEILYGSSSPDETGIRGSILSDPTGQKAVRLITHRRIEQLESIVGAIESVVERLPQEKKKLVQLRYWDRPRMLTWDGIAREISTGRATVFRWRDEIVFAIAEELGWR